MLTQRLLSLSLISTEWIIWGLLLLSVLSLAVIIERVIVLRRKRGNPELLKTRLADAVQQGRGTEAETILGRDGSSAAKVALETLKTMKRMNLGLDDSLAIALSEEKILLEQRIAILGTLGSNAPFIGLFGTVLGIIHAFHSLAQNAKGGPGTVMAGISEALVATALGLFVAIPAVAAYNFFVRHIKKTMVAAENFARAAVPAVADESKRKR